jgi:hypothetical protein
MNTIMTQHSHNTRSKGDSQSSHSLFDQDNTISQISFTIESSRIDRTTGCQAIKTDMDTLAQNLLSITENSNLEQEISDQKQILEDYQHIKL